ncbi:hypothetical protein [Methylophilus sp. Leaf414]|uniref:hypothetical protein n=1 Tax=Methylophilus sp. Leaf414 TaxID=1736371 RepID=UPI001F37EE1B|nr:hypothetical protein [Methylophilus sp. Leaf414]
MHKQNRYLRSGAISVTVNQNKDFKGKQKMNEDKHAGNVILLRTACITLLTGLVLAWCLVMTRGMKIPYMLNIFPSTENLLSAHLDFLMMTMLLLGFYASKIRLPKFVIWPMALGSIGNPTAFLVLAMAPKIQSLTFMVFLYTTLSLTTFGYGMAAIKTLRFSLK